MPAIGEYRWPVLLLKRKLVAPDSFGEEVETFPEAGAATYFAAIEELSGNEQLAGAIRQSNETVRVTVRKPFPAAAVDRLKRLDTGEAYAITGMTSDLTDVVLKCAVWRG